MDQIKRQSGAAPVYVLGAGFSAAVSAHMPVTNGIGEEIKRLLSHEIDVSDIGELGFEDWLTVHVSPMPYLDGHENQKRLADAQRAISVIAEVIEERTTMAAEQRVPLWLEQLIAIWHAERAMVITFNYDNLLERAVNDVMPISLTGDSVDVANAERIVFPAPPPPPAITWDDLNSSRSDSLQLLKVHGSINWYWDAGDPAGSSLTRTRERSRFENRGGVSPDDAGISRLDRFLIPPVATKSDYYTPPLTKILWRMAGSGVRLTNRLTLIGYSMPPTDRATVEMLRRVPSGAAVDVVNRRGQRNEVGRGSVVDRAARLAGGEVRSWSGDECVADYVRGRMTEMITQMATYLSGETTSPNHSSVVVTIPVSRPTAQAVVCALALEGELIVPVEITDFGRKAVSGGSAIEAALNSQAPGAYRMENFVDVSRLRDLLARRGSLVVTHNDRRWVAIAPEEHNYGGSPIMRLHLTPMGA